MTTTSMEENHSHWKAWCDRVTTTEHASYDRGQGVNGRVAKEVGDR